MKLSITKRLKKLEKVFNIDQRTKSAKVVCDADTLHTFDFSFIKADRVLFLPDNGNRVLGGQLVPKDSYVIYYP